MAHTAEDERLLALMRELISRREYSTGEAPFPRPLARADAVAIAADLHQAVDQAIEWRARVVVQEGAHIACHAGCSACCDQLVMIWAAEAELVADWLARPENAGPRAAFLEAYPRWQEQTGDAIDLVQARTAAGDAPGQLAALVAHWRRRIPCAFNRDGLCTIYPVRPIVCRNCHALNTPEHCHPADGTGTAATSMHFQPLERLLKQARGLSRSMHHALGSARGRTEALCTAVYQRLMRDAPP